MYGGCVYVGVVFLCMLVVMAISSHHIISHAMFTDFHNQLVKLSSYVLHR